MAEDKLELNFRELAKAATERVFGSTFPALKSMLSTVKEASESNKENLEDLSGALEQISSRIGDINTGLKKLNESMSRALGYLGKVIDAVKEKGKDGSSKSNDPRDLFKKGAFDTKSAAKNMLLGGSFLSLLSSTNLPSKDNVSTPNLNVKETNDATPTADIDSNRTGKEDASSVNKSEVTSPPAATQQKKAAAATPAPSSGEGPLVFKASTITFDAGQIIFGQGKSQKTSGEVSSGGGGSSAPPPPSSSGGGQAPSSGGGQEAPSSGGAKGGAGTRDMSEAIVAEKGGMTTLKTRSGKNYTVNSQYAQNFFGLVDELEDSGYKIKDIGGQRNSNIAGTNQPSWHSKGMAIDINPGENPVSYKGSSNEGKTNMPSNINEIVAKHGVGWGGNWKDKKLDTMHFSVGPNEFGDPKISEARRGGGGESKTQVASAGGGGSAAATPVEKPAATGATSKASAPLGAEPAAGKPPAATPESKPITTTASGSQINKESISSEVASVTPPARASMNTIVNKNPSESENLPNPKLANANEAGQVEPADAKSRYKELFGLDPRVPTGSTSRAA